VVDVYDKKICQIQESLKHGIECDHPGPGERTSPELARMVQYLYDQVERSNAMQNQAEVLIEEMRWRRNT